MAIGLGRSRSARPGDRGAGASRPTIREVCLIGIDHPARGEGWTAGQEVTWLGRGYRVVASTAATPPQPIDDGSRRVDAQRPAPRYVHLAPWDGD